MSRITRVPSGHPGGGAREEVPPAKQVEMAPNRLARVLHQEGQRTLQPLLPAALKGGSFSFRPDVPAVSAETVHRGPSVGAS